MEYTLDTKLGDLLADPRATEILDKYVPGASQHPMLAIGKTLSLRMIVGMPQAAQVGLTQEKAEAILAEINKAT
jgi:hypothetical protein